MNKYLKVKIKGNKIIIKHKKIFQREKTTKNRCTWEVPTQGNTNLKESKKSQKVDSGWKKEKKRDKRAKNPRSSLTSSCCLHLQFFLGF